jgi:hypothetical protein
VIALHYLSDMEFNIKGKTITKLLFNSDKTYYKDNLYWTIKQYDKYYIATPIISSETTIKETFVEYIKNKKQIMIDQLASNITISTTDAENYSRLIPSIKNEPIPLSVYFMSSNEQYNRELEQYIKHDNYHDFILNYTVKFQQMFIEKYIEFVVDSKIAKQENTTDQSTTLEIYDSKLAHKTYKFMSMLDAIVRLSEIKKYKEVVKLYSGDLSTIDLQDNIPVGYESTNFIRLYDMTISKWFNVNKVAINKQFQYKENSIIVGILSEEESSKASPIKFKLRSPIFTIKEDVSRKLVEKIAQQDKNVSKKSAAKRLTTDTRLLERGSVCLTKTKQEILQIASSLGISLSKLDQNGMKTDNICTLIRNSLIDSEIQERTKKSIYKYMYGWWSSEPNIQQYVVS